MVEMTGRRIRVLIVDDEPRIVRILSLKLKLSGYDPIAAASGVEGVEMVRTQSPDVVLLDIIMPGMSGIEALEKIRCFSSVPVVVMTARPDVAEVVAGLGANAFITKPFDPEQPIEKIGSVLSGGNGGSVVGS